MELLNVKDFINKLNKEDELKKNDWNIRLVRHYTSIGAIPPPEKKGKEAFYSELHLQKAKEISEGRAMGVSIHKVYSPSYKGAELFKTASASSDLVHQQEPENQPAIVNAFSGLDVDLKNADGISTEITFSEKYDDSTEESKTFITRNDPLDFNLAQSISHINSTYTANNADLSISPSDQLKEKANSLLNQWGETPLNYAKSGAYRISSTRGLNGGIQEDFTKKMSLLATPNSLVPREKEDIKNAQPIKSQPFEKYVIEDGLELHASQAQKKKAEELLKLWHEKNN